jgi:hypothetical protein
MRPILTVSQVLDAANGVPIIGDVQKVAMTYRAADGVEYATRLRVKHSSTGQCTMIICPACGKTCSGLHSNPGRPGLACIACVNRCKGLGQGEGEPVADESDTGPMAIKSISYTKGD